MIANLINFRKNIFENAWLLLKFSKIKPFENFPLYGIPVFNAIHPCTQNKSKIPNPCELWKCTQICFCLINQPVTSSLMNDLITENYILTDSTWFITERFIAWKIQTMKSLVYLCNNSKKSCVSEYPLMTLQFFWFVIHNYYGKYF